MHFKQIHENMTQWRAVAMSLKLCFEILKPLQHFMLEIVKLKGFS